MEYIEEINNKLINWMITVALAIDRAMCVRQARQSYIVSMMEKEFVSTHTHTRVGVGPDGGNFNIRANQSTVFHSFFSFLICKIVFACRMRRLDPRTLPIVYNDTSTQSIRSLMLATCVWIDCLTDLLCNFIICKISSESNGVDGMIDLLHGAKHTNNENAE